MDEIREIATTEDAEKTTENTEVKKEKSMNELKKIVEVIKENKSFFITSHIRPDGDSIGSQLALKCILERLGKEVTIANHDSVPEIYDFLPGRESIKQELPKDREFDVALVLDSPELSRLESAAGAIEKARVIINIDHHLGNERFGKYNYVDIEASAVGEEIYELTKVMGFEIDREIALCLYVGILTDTGSFRQSNTTPRTHEIVADLMKIGDLKPAQITHQVYETQLPSAIKLLSMTLNTLERSEDGRIAWMTITDEMFKETTTTKAETENFINYVRSVKGSEVAILFTRIAEGEVKVSFRSKSSVDVNRIAKTFGGGGHLRASACTIKGDFKEVKEKVLAEVEKQLKI
ncbi:bifunctional oligoribonuclease/PAP phosphatase NrnA [bacterium]|nr:bifunctional oligoribonuclease/PAP phosphatase NrnA [bacterium]MCG2676370.1 bifunctional oligoribonuclease/PAP phosphatase NrnA [bacterium]